MVVVVVVSGDSGSGETYQVTDEHRHHVHVVVEMAGDAVAVVVSAVVSLAAQVVEVVVSTIKFPVTVSIHAKTRKYNSKRKEEKCIYRDTSNCASTCIVQAVAVCIQANIVSLWWWWWSLSLSVGWVD